MAKIKKMWTEQECKYVIDNRDKLTYSDMAKAMGRTLESVKSKINKVLKLPFKSQQKFKLQKLLGDTADIWYWLGFIAGDGCFVGNYLSITVSSVDTEHLLQLSEMLDINLQTTKSGYKTISVADAGNIEELKNKIGVSSGKTYKGIDLDLFKISEKNANAFIIGLIDADGCVELQKNGLGKCVKIELHESWLNFLNQISEYLLKKHQISSKVLLNSRGYSLFRITSHENILKLKNLTNNLPVLKRKWDNIKNVETNRFFDKYKDEIKSRFMSGDNLHKIAKDLNLNYNSLYNHKNKITAWT